MAPPEEPVPGPRKSSPSFEDPIKGRYDLQKDTSRGRTVANDERYASQFDDDSDTDSEMHPDGGLGDKLPD